MAVYQIRCSGQVFYAEARSPLDVIDVKLFRACAADARQANPKAVTRALVKDTISRFNAKSHTRLVLACQPWTGSLEV